MEITKITEEILFKSFIVLSIVFAFVVALLLVVIYKNHFQFVVRSMIRNRKSSKKRNPRHH